MSSWVNRTLAQLFNLSQSFNQTLRVPDDFHGQMIHVKKLLQQDDTGLIVPILNFQIRAANVDINFDGSSSGLTNLFNDWKQEVNKNVNIDIPRGLKSLSENYYRERWKSSLIVLRMVWENFNGYMMPMKMWIMDGASIHIQNNSLALEDNKYFLGDPNKNQKLEDNATQTILIRKPYNQFHDQYSTPYLVGNGALKHKLRLEALTNHQNEMIATAFSYQMLLKMGSDAAQARGDNPQDTDLNNLLTQFQDLKAKIDQHVYSRGLAGAFPHDVKIEEFIPDFKKIMDEAITKPVLQRILSAMGMIELKGFSATREEAILNPKVLVEETEDAVLDYTDLLNEVIAQIKEKNSNRYKINDKVVIQPGIIKAFLTKEDKQMIRSWWDRGLVGDKSALENTSGLLFERQVKERDYERKEGLDLRMFCRVIQNQDNGLNDVPDTENNSPDKSGPEKNNYKNAKQIQSSVDKANEIVAKKDGFCVCENCKSLIGYQDQPEAGMGYIKCPICGVNIDQSGKCYKPIEKSLSNDELIEKVGEIIESQLNKLDNEKIYVVAEIKTKNDIPDGVGKDLTDSQKNIFVNSFNEKLSECIVLGMDNYLSEKTAMNYALEKAKVYIEAPYKTNDDLPDSVKNALPEHAQTIFRNAFNSALKSGKSEETAFKIAWGAVKKSYKKVGDKWVKKSELKKAKEINPEDKKLEELSKIQDIEIKSKKSKLLDKLLQENKDENI